MTKAMEADRGDIKPGEEFPEIVPVITWLQRTHPIAHDIEIVIHEFDERPEDLHQFTAHRNVPHGCVRLRRADRQGVIPFAPVVQPYSLDGFGDVDYAVLNIQILPLESTDFTDSKAGVKTYDQPQVSEREIGPEICQQPFLIGRIQDGDDLCRFCRCGIMDIELDSGPAAILHAKVEDHPQDYNRIANRPHTDSANHLIDISLNYRLGDLLRSHLAEIGQKMLVHLVDVCRVR